VHLSPVLEVDGLLINPNFVIMNEVKESADIIHVVGGITEEGRKIKGLKQRVDSLKKWISDLESTTNPPEVMEQLRKLQGKEIVPVLSAYKATPEAVEACRQNNIFCLLPQGAGGAFPL
jgi:hypothetical protein